MNAFPLSGRSTDAGETPRSTNAGVVGAESSSTVTVWAGELTTEPSVRMRARMIRLILRSSGHERERAAKAQQAAVGCNPAVSFEVPRLRPTLEVVCNRHPVVVRHHVIDDAAHAQLLANQVMTIPDQQVAEVARGSYEGLCAEKDLGGPGLSLTDAQGQEDIFL